MIFSSFLKKLSVLALFLAVSVGVQLATPHHAQAAAPTSCAMNSSSQFVTTLVKVGLYDENGTFVKWADSYQFHVQVPYGDGSGYGSESPLNALGNKQAKFLAAASGTPEPRWGQQVFTVNSANAINCGGGAAFKFDYEDGTDGSWFIDCLYNAARQMFGVTVEFNGVSVNEAGWENGSWTQTAAIGPGGGIGGGTKVTKNSDMNNNNYSVVLKYQKHKTDIGEHLPTGNLEQADCSTISGWASDEDKPDQSTYVEIWVDGVHINAGDNLFANNPRADVGNHGFSMNTPAKYRDGSTHAVDAKAIGIRRDGSFGDTGSPLEVVYIGSTKYFTCPAPATLSVGVLLDGQNTLGVNPCAAPVSDICGQNELTVRRTSADAVPAGQGFSTGATVTPGSPNSVSVVGSLYPGQFDISINPAKIPSGWKVIGYVECDDGAALDCYKTRTYQAYSATTKPTTIQSNRTRPFYYVLGSIDAATCSISSGAGAIDIGASHDFSVQMTNTGGSTWTATRNYALTVSPPADWDVAPDSLKIHPGESVAGGASRTFVISAILKDTADLTAGSLGIAFRMSYVDAFGTTVGFGATCPATMVARAVYDPWIGVQNGGVSALEKILGQPEGSRGFRHSEAVSSAAAPNDVNLEAQYAVISSYVADMNPHSHFCSTNGYTYGHVDVNFCDFAGYSLEVNHLSKSDYVNAPTDPIYDNAHNLLAYNTCDDNGGYDEGKQDKRTFATADSTNPTTAFDSHMSLQVAGHLSCGTVTAKDITRIGIPSGAGAIKNLTIDSGRATWVVPGNLDINSNIYNGSGWSVDSASDPKKMNSIPNLGIIVNGDVTIGRNVTELDVVIYATGKIITCDLPANAVCNKPIIVKGSLSARGGFELRRNFYDAAGITSRLTGHLAVSNPNFDFVGAIAGTSQGQYYGGPAEDIVGTGLSFIWPPPGLENYSAGFDKAKYLPADLSPRF